MRGVKTPGGTHTVQFGTTSICFELLYSERKTLSLHIYPDSTIEVDAPVDTQFEAIKGFVRRRGSWILRQLRELERYERPSVVLPRRYVSGETYRYLGRQYRLKVVQDTTERVTLSRGWLAVSVANPADRPRVQVLLGGWYHSHAELIFVERLDVCYPRIAALGISKPRLLIRAMKTRWGSCSGNGKVTINLKLIQAPRSLIDYVILHELCHLKEPNHSRRFWSLLDRVLPGWERLRIELNKYEFGEI